MANLQILLLLFTISAVSVSWGKSVSPREQMGRKDVEGLIPKPRLSKQRAVRDEMTDEEIACCVYNDGDEFRDVLNCTTRHWSCPQDTVFVAKFKCCLTNAETNREGFSDNDCTPLDATDKIVGGSVTAVNEYPFMVQCLFDGSLCGGTILNRWTVLTAAQCVKGKHAANSKVVVGEHHMYQSSGIEQTIDVKEFKLHPDYDSCTYENDVALVHLKEAIVYTDKVYSACVPDSCPSDSNRHAGQSCVAIGWGTNSSGGSISYELRHVNVTTLSTNKCIQAYKYEITHFVEGKMICAAANSKDSCHGDTGGPFICGNALAGIVSWAYGCAQSDYPGVYANVCWYTDWIKANLWTQ